LRWFVFKRVDEYRIPKRVLDMKLSRKKTQAQITNTVARPSQRETQKEEDDLGGR
jgi:hypothetical protein